MSPELAELSAKIGGQKTLVEAKMKEFEGYMMVGNGAAADKVREETHALLDSYFDSQAEAISAMRRGKFL